MEQPRLAPGRVPLLAALGVATVLGAIASGQHHLMMREHGGDLTALHALEMGMPYWFLWILLAPLILWFIGRVPLEGPRPVLRAVQHLAFAVLVTVFHSTLESVLRAGFGIYRLSPAPRLLWNALLGGVGSLSFDLPSYGTILGLLYAAGYYQRFREGERAASNLAVQLAQAKLEALRSQLNPHFFFNAMNSVAMLVRAGRNDEAVRSLAELSELLRYVLEENPAVEVPLSEDLGFLERYLAIERVRFHDRLRVRVTPDPETLEAWVPNMILQPLVENAIRHGIGRRAAAGLVEISARREGDRLLLSVRDDGPGPNGTATPLPISGLGLRNTRARLAQLHGREQSLELTEADGGGALASISLPFRTHPAAAALAPA